MRSRGLVIFDAFNTLVTARRGSEQTFLAGLARAGLNSSRAMLGELQAASEGLDHSGWSGSRQAYCGWAAETLAAAAQAGGDLHASLAPHVVPALEQWHQAAMVALPGAADCLTELRRAGFTIAVCSNWGGIWPRISPPRVWPPASTSSSHRPRLAIGSRIRASTTTRSSGRDSARTMLSLSATACGPTFWGRNASASARCSWPRQPRARPITSRWPR